MKFQGNQNKRFLEYLRIPSSAFPGLLLWAGAKDSMVDAMAYFYVQIYKLMCKEWF